MDVVRYSTHCGLLAKLTHPICTLYAQVTWVTWVQEAVSALMQYDAAQPASSGAILKLQLHVAPDGFVTTRLQAAGSE